MMREYLNIIKFNRRSDSDVVYGRNAHYIAASAWRGRSIPRATRDTVRERYPNDFDGL